MCHSLTFEMVNFKVDIKVNNATTDTKATLDKKLFSKSQDTAQPVEF